MAFTPGGTVFGWPCFKRCVICRLHPPFKVYVCTTAEREYALEAWRLLDPKGELIPQQLRQKRITTVGRDKGSRDKERKNIASVVGLTADPGALNYLRTAMPLALILDDLVGVCTASSGRTITSKIQCCMLGQLAPSRDICPVFYALGLMHCRMQHTVSSIALPVVMCVQGPCLQCSECMAHQKAPQIAGVDEAVAGACPGD